MSGEQSHAHDETIEISRDVKLMIVMHSNTREGHPRWEFTPGVGNVLKGRAWDAAKEPRLTLVDKRKPNQKHLEHAIFVEVRCLREDLVIEDIELKDEGRMQKWISSVNPANKRAAAESYIRDQLMQVGLEVEANAIEDKFGQLILARTTAAPPDA